MDNLNDDEQLMAIRVEVGFRWKNPDFLLKNPDFLFRNPDLLFRSPDFLLTNADFIMKQSEFGSVRPAPSTPGRAPFRSTDANALPGAAELHALCPAVSPAVSAQPPASPYMTHAEKQTRRLKAELDIAYGNLEELRNRGDFCIKNDEICSKNDGICI